MAILKIVDMNSEQRSMSEPRHIIISRTDSIGDVVLTLPVAGILKKIYPNSRISFLGRSYTEAIIALSTNVDHFINWDILSENTPEDQVMEFKRLQADWIVHAYPDHRIASLGKRAGIENRVGTSHRLFHWLTCNKRVHFSRKRSDDHEAQLNLKLLSPLGLDVVPERSTIHEFYGMSKLPEVSEELSSLIDPLRFNLILHPRSSGSAREWGLDNYAHLIELLPEEKFKIFITGTQAEAGTMKVFLEKNITRINNLTGRFNLKELVLFISLVDGLVAASTGPLHIAAALGKRTVGLFAPMRSIHPGRWAPIGKAATALVIDKVCKSCRRTQDCACIRSIPPASVIEALRRQR
jgi:heptosyltransferase III